MSAPQFTLGPWVDHDGGPRPVAPDTKVRVYRYSRYFEELDADKIGSHTQLASSVDWANRPGEKLKYRIVGKSAEAVASELRIRDAAPELYEALDAIVDALPASLLANGLLKKADAALAKARGEQA